MHCGFVSQARWHAMVIHSPTAFSEAVTEFELESVQLEGNVLGAIESAMAESGMLLVGEPHGVCETPAAMYAIICSLGVRAVAFEWSYDELDDLVQAWIEQGAFDFSEFWSLPPTSEFFAGDGRITAGHFALLDRLRSEDQLDQVILFDRLDPEPLPHWQVRDQEMADRLLSVWDGKPLLALTGAFHAQTGPQSDGDPMGCHVVRRRAGTKAAMLNYTSGACWSRGTTHDLSGDMPPADIVIKLPHGTPADVPGRSP